ncbi:tumor necrosis factor ligand superfamily member 14-like [Chanos chanos]|uniref:Tumor necrosis factor ligand superfamily member 14-like n=1 Tax=Chanos chanos TaxID=29144 RepID=A0A6J2WMU0_CHACN|nr:tumor necrosis factor ligand superfamily member 14-like [Chanos chanos]
MTVAWIDYQKAKDRLKMINMSSEKVAYSSVFLENRVAHPPSFPQEIPHHPKAKAERLLYVLITLALCGLAVEACFIYNLYGHSRETFEEVRLSSHAVVKHQEKENTPTPRPNPFMKPSKPLAHLTGGADSFRKDGIMIWDDPTIYEMVHVKTEGMLVVQREGYYFVYSKICFGEDYFMFTHSVVRVNQRYQGVELDLLRSRTYQSKGQRKTGLSNSFLAGVFHLFKNDAIFVRVSNQTLVRRSDSSENFFGAYML